MTPQERLALALQYQKQRDLGSVLPSMPAENAARPVQEPEQSWLDKLSEVASGVGYGLGQQVDGLGQMARHPLDTLHSIAVGAGKAMDNPSAAAQAAWQGIKQSAGEAVSSPFNLGQAVGANVNINPRKLAAMLESPAVREITAYHGTPHRFPATEANPLGEFDASKINTGEGAQAYGHGIYLAESPDVAHGYAYNLGYQKGDKPKIGDQEITDLYSKIERNAAKLPYEKSQLEYQKLDLLERLMGEQATPASVLKNVQNQEGWNPEAIDWFNKNVAPKYKSPGNFYHADLPDEMVDRMLDWDKPLSEQPAALAAIKNMPEGKFLTKQGKNIENLTGQTFHRLIADSSAHGHKDSYRYAANRLKEAGIPGIRYLDEGSRSKFQVQNTYKGNPYGDPVPFATEQQAINYAKEQAEKGFGTNMIPGTRNFVVFPGEEKKVKILERK